jgi:hypothetical protein
VCNAERPPLSQASPSPAGGAPRSPGSAFEARLGGVLPLSPQRRRYRSPSSRCACATMLRDVDAEELVEFGRRRRFAEAVDADHRAVRCRRTSTTGRDVAASTATIGSRRRQHLLPIGSGCRSNRCVQGMATTRAGDSFVPQHGLGVEARLTSEPVASSTSRAGTARGLAQDIAAAPDARRSAAALRDSAGRFCRDSRKARGAILPLESSGPGDGGLQCIGRAPDVQPGNQRSEAACSIGWCVGPSSPRPIESCV